MRHSKFLKENVRVGNSDRFWRGNWMAMKRGNRSEMGNGVPHTPGRERDLCFSVHLSTNLNFSLCTHSTFLNKKYYLFLLKNKMFSTQRTDG